MESNSENKTEVKEIKVDDVVTLDKVEIGTSGKISSISGDGRIRRRIFDMGLTPGTEVYLRKRAPLGDPLEITIRGYELTLRKNEAQWVSTQVTELPERK